MVWMSCILVSVPYDIFFHDIMWSREEAAAAGGQQCTSVRAAFVVLLVDPLWLTSCVSSCLKSLLSSYNLFLNAVSLACARHSSSSAYQEFPGCLSITACQPAPQSVALCLGPPEAP